MPISYSRKKFIQQILGSAVASAIPFSIMAKNEDIIQMPGETPFSIAPDDETFWNDFAKKNYVTEPGIINLENGYFGVQPQQVLQSYLRHINRVNTNNSRFARQEFGAIFKQNLQTLAGFLEVSPDELLITRNATEALNIAIQGYPFHSGDEVIINQLDYFSMIETFQMLEQRGEIRLRPFELPLLPKDEEEIVEEYKRQITAKTKVILLTHVSNITGMIIPVSRIAAMAKAQGIDTITDSAHALGHIPFKLSALQSDFVGLNLHKWIGNPLGAGVLYVRKERIPELKSLYGDKRPMSGEIARLGHMGTTPFAVQMSIADSIAFHQQAGIENITQRLHYLKSIWTNEVKGLDGVELVTPIAQNMSCAMASFRFRDKDSREVADKLFDQHKIFTVARILGDTGCVRVTPALYNTATDVKALATAIRKLV